MKMYYKIIGFLVICFKRIGCRYSKKNKTMESHSIISIFQICIKDSYGNVM